MNPSPSKSNAKVSTASSGGSSSGTLVWAAVIAVIVLVGGVAVFLARGSDDKPPIADETAAATVDAPASGGGDGLQVAVQGGLPLMPEAGADPAVGMTIPTVSGVTVDGKPITIGPDGGPKVLVFMAHWCPHCQAEIPKLAEHFAGGGLPDDVEIVGISTRVDADRPNYPPSSWLKDESWTVPTLKDSVDSTAFLAFGAGGFPYFVAVDAEGKVVARTSGELPMETFDRFVDVARTGSV
jgi:cytochrome c biogenesis protein CcmG/thiol:disulfide interchange protein DsbE